jgi:glycosyltransferase involved in cell wall biosynthesis
MELPKGMINWIQAIYKNRFQIRQSDCLVVMSPCHILTAPLKIVGRKPLILDAGWSLTDGHISRELKIMKFLKLPLVMLIDFISFHLADIVLVETKAQSRRINKYFAVNESKLRVQFTGLNESSFTAKESDSKVLKGIKKRIAELGYPLIVLFRGKINLESGFENILSAAKILNDSVIFIFVVGKNDTFRECPRNAIIVSQITDNEMHDIYRLSDISIGQVSTHPRLRYTIPHKAFEAGFFSMPYITADSAGVREYLHQGSALFLEHPSSESLVRAINDLKDDTTRRAYAKKINLIYRESASQKILSEKFDQILLQLCDTKAHKLD